MCNVALMCKHGSFLSQEVPTNQPALLDNPTKLRINLLLSLQSLVLNSHPFFFFAET